MTCEPKQGGWSQEQPPEMARMSVKCFINNKLLTGGSGSNQKNPKKTNRAKIPNSKKTLKKLKQTPRLRLSGKVNKHRVRVIRA